MSDNTPKIIPESLDRLTMQTVLQARKNIEWQGELLSGGDIQFVEYLDRVIFVAEIARQEAMQIIDANWVSVLDTPAAHQASHDINCERSETDYS